MERGTRVAPGRLTCRNSRESSVWPETGAKESNAPWPWRISAKFGRGVFWSLGLWKSSSDRERSDIGDDNWVLALKVGAGTIYGLRHRCHKEIGRRAGSPRIQRSWSLVGCQRNVEGRYRPSSLVEAHPRTMEDILCCWVISDDKCLVSRVHSIAGELCPVLKFIS
jgi:hypothetical protein